jgi:Arabinose efflux permease
MGAWTMWHTLHRNIKIRLIISFLSAFVGNMVFPFMAMYFALSFGSVLAGSLLLINVLISASTGFIGGYLSDRIGRKPMMIVAQALGVGALTGMALANSPVWISPVFTFLMMVMQNFSSGMMHPAEEAMLIDVSTEANRRLMYSVSYWSTNLGMAAGTAIGGLFFHTYRFYLFLALCSASVIILGLIVFCMVEVYQQPESPRREHAPVRSLISHYSRVLSHRLFIVYCVGNLFVLSLEFQTTNYIAVHLEQRFQPVVLNAWLNLTSYTMISWMQIENTLIVVILALVILRITKYLSASSVLLIGLPIYSLGYAMQAFSTQWGLLAFAVLLASLGELMYVPASQSLLASLTSADSRASYMAVYSLVFQSGKLLGAAGIIIGAFLPPAAMAALFLLAGLTGMGCYLSVCRKKLQN